ncbi:MAG: hypothetical protein EPO07_10735 [Verrucomicrobia bacterium]|nr:MAG: hypothetical protein EPO07_10735 [Verrucomicrobiota bacterium]
MKSENQISAELRCDECGRFGAIDFGEKKLCPDCYEHHGSCCPEFGREETSDCPELDKSKP